MYETNKQPEKANLAKFCTVETCIKDRVYRTAYCRSHLNSEQINGHPLANALKRHQYAKELEETKALLADNNSHVGILRALSILDKWLVEAVDRKDFPGSGEIARLVHGGVTALDILTECVAVYAFNIRNPSPLDSEDVFTHQITNAVLRLAPRKKIASTSTGYVYGQGCSIKVRRAIGFHLRGLLDPFYELLTFEKTIPKKISKSPLEKLSGWLKQSYRRNAHV